MANMTDTEKYLFDLNGFLIVRGVLSPAEVAQANASIDARQAEFKTRDDRDLRNTKDGTPLAGDGVTPRKDLGGFMGWPSPDGDVFRKMLAHPKLVPYLNELCGSGYRLDHMPLLLAGDKGSEGFSLHGGTINDKGEFVPYLAYQYSHGKMYNPLLAASFSLVDHPKGSGGFVCIRGSHKANFPTPRVLIDGHDDLDGCLYQPETKAGDVVLFSEGTVHGATAWNLEYQRRLCLIRFAPSTVAYGRAYSENAGRWPEAFYEHLTQEQAAVLEPPYNVRLDRPTVSAAPGCEPHDGDSLQTEVSGRTLPKKEFDRTTFGTKYF